MGIKDEVLVTEFLNKCRDVWGLAPKTLQARAEAYDLYFNKYQGAFTLESFEGFLAWMKARNNTVQTRVSRASAVRLLVKYAVRKGFCEDFTSDIKLPVIYSESPQVVPSPDAERAALAGTEIGKTDNKKIREHKIIGRIALRFDLRTGLRKSELLGLTPADLRLEQGYFYVRTTKSHKTVAQPLTWDMVDEMKEWIKDMQPSEKIFKISAAALNGFLHRGSKRVGLSIRLHLHSLRDCYCSDQLARRVSMQTVKDNMRHKDFSSLGKYSAAQMDDRIAAANSSPIVEGGLTTEQKVKTLEAIIRNCGIKITELKSKGGKIQIEV